MGSNGMAIFATVVVIMVVVFIGGCIYQIGYFEGQVDYAKGAVTCWEYVDQEVVSIPDCLPANSQTLE